jgi:hypothetical protein
VGRSEIVRNVLSSEAPGVSAVMLAVRSIVLRIGRVSVVTRGLV